MRIQIGWYEAKKLAALKLKERKLRAKHTRAMSVEVQMRQFEEAYKQFVGEEITLKRRKNGMIEIPGHQCIPARALPIATAKIYAQLHERELGVE